MNVFAIHETLPAESSRALHDRLIGKTIGHCGVMVLEPGQVAHAGERHTHPHDEFMVVLKGEVTVPITHGPTEVVRVGDWLMVPNGREHHVTNHTPFPAVVMHLVVR